ncbi:MAG: succinate dehydrogenase iron-sulfur subunit [Nitrososphaera sp.]|jgi:succinate dehydrogenase / fumarate reductase iron-sulfur subunit
MEQVKVAEQSDAKHTEKAHKQEKETLRSSVTLRVFRANRKTSEHAHFDTIEVPVQRWTTVLDALLYAKSYKDSSIGIRYSCRMASCGSCGMKINGIPRLACYTKVSELSGSSITIEPLSNFPHIRDLVTDFTQFFKHHHDVKPYILGDDPVAPANSGQGAEGETYTENIQTPEDVDKYLQFSYCIKCGLCYSACPTVATDTKFPGPQALAQAYRYTADTRDADTKSRLNVLDDRHGIWRCHFAGSCSSVCPKGVDPALGIQLLRGHLLGFSKNENRVAEKKRKTLDLL